MGYPVGTGTACYGGFNSATVLVLFILLVIVTMTFAW
ncbi:YjcZ family sporulation protein [Paenibacillus sp. SI8]